MGKRYTSTEDMLSASGLDDSLRDQIRDRIESRQIIKKLLALRVRQGKSQRDIADAFGCTQSRISKLENGTDEEIRLGDLVRYFQSLDHGLSLFIAKSEWGAMDQIKYHAFEIKRCLTRLVELVQDDPKIGKGVANAHFKTLADVAKIIIDSAKTLPEVPLALPTIMEPDSDEDVAESYEESPPSVLV